MTLNTTSSSQTDGDWYLVEQHEANPLFDLIARTDVRITDAACLESFSLVESTRPSFAQVAALKSASSHNRHPQAIKAPVMVHVPHMHDHKTVMSVTGATKCPAAEYTIKKSGKAYIAVKS